MSWNTNAVLDLYKDRSCPIFQPVHSLELNHILTTALPDTSASDARPKPAEERTLAQTSIITPTLRFPKLRRHWLCQGGLLRVSSPHGAQYRSVKVDSSQKPFSFIVMIMYTSKMEMLKRERCDLGKENAM